MLRARLGHAVCFSSLVYLVAHTSLAAAQEGPPRVQIDTVPSGANVYIDDRATGIQCQSGLACKLKLKKGPHKLIVELDGYRTMEQTIAVTGAQRFSFKLLSTPATLDVRMLATNQSAHGAELFVDGKLKGIVPTALEVNEGKHLIEVRRGGFQPFAEHVEVKAGEQRPLFVSLTLLPREAPPTPTVERTPTPIIVQMPPAPVPAPPPSPEDPGVPVVIVPSNPKFTYVATLGPGQSCTTPCTVRALPGRTSISISGPGDKYFQDGITIPNSSTQIAVQHFTLSRAISGPILLTLGAGALAGGALWLSRGSIPILSSSLDTGLAVFTLAHGVAFVAAGIGELARIKRNRVEVRSSGR